MPLPQQILKRLPERTLDFSSLRRTIAMGQSTSDRTSALEAAYGGGFIGCYVDTDENDQVYRDAARWLTDEAKGGDGTFLFSNYLS